MKILIVDDEYEKAKQLSQAISEKYSDADISHVTTANAARHALREKLIDLLIVDLNLPDVVGAAPTTDGGIQLFDLLMKDRLARLPGEILFISAKNELVEEATQKCAMRGITFVHYGPEFSAWKAVVLGRCAMTVERQARSRMLPEADVALVTALRSPELDAVLDLPYEWSKLKIEEEPTTYYLGKVKCAQREVTIIAACAQRKGMPSAAALSSRLSVLFKPKLLVMPGICAGVEGKVKLGDVIIADPSWDWGSGKQVEGEAESIVFLAAPHQRPLKASMAQLVSDVCSDSNVLARIKAGWKGDVPEGVFSARMGPMASGASVVANSKIVQAIVEKQRDVLGIEMEAYAVMAAAEYSSEPVPVAIAIKSVCDFGDASKGDKWQKYAAYTSAAFVSELIQAHYA